MTLEQQLLQQFQILPLTKQVAVLDFVQLLAEQERLCQATKRIPKRLGLLKGKLKVADAFDAPLPNKMLKIFYANLFCY